LLSGGLKEIGDLKEMSFSGLIQVLKRGAANPKILLGVLLEAIFFGTLLYLLSQRDVSLIWPLTSLGFVLTTLTAKFFLNEQVSFLRWSGVFLIVMGAAIITYSEKVKDRKPESAQSSSSLDAGQ